MVVGVVAAAEGEAMRCWEAGSYIGCLTTTYVADIGRVWCGV